MNIIITKDVVRKRSRESATSNLSIFLEFILNRTVHDKGYSSLAKIGQITSQDVLKMFQNICNYSCSGKAIRSYMACYRQKSTVSPRKWIYGKKNLRMTKNKMTKNYGQLLWYPHFERGWISAYAHIFFNMWKSLSKWGYHKSCP